MTSEVQQFPSSPHPLPPPLPPLTLPQHACCFPSPSLPPPPSSPSLSPNLLRCHSESQACSGKPGSTTWRRQRTDFQLHAREWRRRRRRRRRTIDVPERGDLTKLQRVVPCKLCSFGGMDLTKESTTKGLEGCHLDTIFQVNLVGDDPAKRC